eukprot:3827683-Prymnesium_polylepis.2
MDPLEQCDACLVIRWINTVGNRGFSCSEASWPPRHPACIVSKQQSHNLKVAVPGCSHKSRDSCCGGFLNIGLVREEQVHAICAEVPGCDVQRCGIIASTSFIDGHGWVLEQQGCAINVTVLARDEERRRTMIAIALVHVDTGVLHQ